ncbi:MAG: DUF1501 domain-containing protein [Planctomycetota bacterium]
MNPNLQHHTRVAVRRGAVVGRRDFLRTATLASLGASSLNLTDVLTASAGELRKRGKACILLWMQGGPSQFETFSPKPNHRFGGGTKAISTAVPGIEYAENLPECAKVADQLAVIRSMTSREGNHQRATFLLHHGYLPMGGVKFPTLGSNVAHQIGDDDLALPSYVRVGRRLANGGSGGFLGVEYDPLELNSAKRPPDNTVPPFSEKRFERRLSLLNRLGGAFHANGGSEAAADHRKLVDRAVGMVTSPEMEAFDLAKEPDASHELYGEGDFASGCLLARRLVERGVPFVEVVSPGWDTHQDNFNQVGELAARVDRPTAALVADLHDRGLLDDTLVVWMGEFGRTPQINGRSGRDHFPRAFNAVLAGGGVRGGQVVGATNEGGNEVTDRPVLVEDLFRTIYHALGIDADHENISRIGRPIKLVEGGAVVQELFG